ncbi:MAG: hypothetical protein QXY62_06325, partial [Candidatus Altiarchaeota archaeon]
MDKKIKIIKCSIRRILSNFVVLLLIISVFMQNVSGKVVSEEKNLDLSTRQQDGSVSLNISTSMPLSISIAKLATGSEQTPSLSIAKLSTNKIPPSQISIAKLATGSEQTPSLSIAKLSTNKIPPSQISIAKLATGSEQ